jgi:hypothetical protein
VDRSLIETNTADGLTFVDYISSWRREDPACPPEEMIEKLFGMMEEYVLDPTFENYGGFVDEDPKLFSGQTEFTSVFGNFYDYSYVFRIFTKDALLISRFKEAVAKNQAKESYQRAKQIRIEQEEKQRKNYGLNPFKTLARIKFENSFKG